MKWINSYLNIYTILFALAVLILIIKGIFFVFKKRRPTIGNAQILGAVGVQNDYFGTLETQNGIIAVVSDGIGRSKLGRKCAEIVVNTFLAQFDKAGPIIDHKQFLSRTLMLANQRVTKYTIDINCGATLSAVIICNNKAHWINIGNSCIMVASKEEIIRLSKTYTQLYINEPTYKRKPQAYYDRYIGIEDDLKAQNGHFDLDKTQRQVLLCTDGVYQQISEMDMLKVLKSSRNAYDKAQEILLQIARKKRSDQDNATLIVLDIC